MKPDISNEPRCPGSPLDGDGLEECARRGKRRGSFFNVVAGAAVAVLLAAPRAHAVPSFARQTGMACDACHSAGFYPELNNFGRMFKINGYLWSAHEDRSYETTPPFAAAQEWSYTYTRKAQPGLTRRGDREQTSAWASDGNSNFSFPQQASFFFAGRYYGHLGGFYMGTYDGADDRWATDNVDLRLTDSRIIGDNHPFVYGLTLNNGPTVQDPWNTLPAWSQLVASEVAPGPAASPTIANLAGQVSGVGAYAFWDDLVYAEVTPYVSAKNGALSFIAAGNAQDTVTDGVSPYWRLVLYKNKGSHSLSFGQVGLYDEIHQAGSHGPVNRFLDIGGDVQYQWNQKPHFVTFRATGIWEGQDLSAAKAAMAAARATHDLYTVQLWGSYFYYNLAGITLSFFDTLGTRDPTLYAPAELEGSRNGSPDTAGGFVQLNVLPLSRWFNVHWPALPMTQLALQYTFYGRFNGASSNYDGSGRSAADNNTLYLLLWTPW